MGLIADQVVEDCVEFCVLLPRNDHEGNLASYLYPFTAR
jgi:hypothetical protein